MHSMNKYNLPRGYLSFSSWKLWKTSKEQFRKKYYHDQGHDLITPEILFGKSFAKQLENKEKTLEQVMLCSHPEYPMVVDFKGITLKGFIDCFDPETLQIIEYKTGHALWNRALVQKHKQLDFYCLMTFLKFGKYNPNVILQWLPTEVTLAKKTGMIRTHKKIKLTGEVKTFKRKIYKWEIEKLKKDILLVAKEISADYTKFLNEFSKSKV